MLQYKSNKIQFRNNKLIFASKAQYEIFYASDGDFITFDNKMIHVKLKK